MDALRRFLAILGADLRQRGRSPRFWLMLLAVGAASWWFFPPASADYLTVSTGNGERGWYSSAWIGLMLALMHGMLLSLAGFYLLRGTLARDIETRVWLLLVATPMTRAGYLLAKWASHLTVMGLLMAVGLLVGLTAQWVHAEDRSLDLVELVKPLLVLSLPAVALTCAMAIWFDLVPGLRRSAGNVLFFVLWLTATSLGISQFDPKENPAAKDSWMSDPNGVALVVRDLGQRQRDAEGNPRFSLSVGSQRLPEGGPRRFEWRDWPVQSRDLAGRALWLGLALLLVLAAAPLLDRFAARSAAEATHRPQAGRRLRWLDRLLLPLRLLPQGGLIAAELQQVLRRRAWWWWLLALVFAAMQLFAGERGLIVAVLGAWLLWIDVFSRLILREQENGTAALVLSAPRIRWRLLAVRLGTVLLLAWASVLPALLRLAANHPEQALAVLAGGASLALWGLALGALLRTPRPYEVTLLALAYGGIQNGGPLALLAHADWALAVHLQGLPLALAILILAWWRASAPEHGHAPSVRAGAADTPSPVLQST
jgi:hypothetical protein